MNSNDNTPPVYQTEHEATLDTPETDPGSEVPQNDSEEKIEIPEELKPRNADLIIIDDPLMEAVKETSEQMDLFGTMKEIVELGVISAMETTKETNTVVNVPQGFGKTTMKEQFEKQLEGGVQVVTAPQLFPTPPDIAERMVELADIKPGMSVLEPSAGTGNIVRALDEEGGCMITAVEINSKLCDLLRETFRFRQLVNDDFLSCNGNLGTFDRVLMNPPFENAADIKHIEKAIEYLKPGGSLVALCANGPRQQKRFKVAANLWEELPAGSFKRSGTMVNVALLKITKGGC